VTVAEIAFRNVSKVFPGGAVAVDDLDLVIDDGEFMVIVGPSGSGKTTVLRLLAGLEELTEGEISIGGHVVDHLHPMDRDVAMVFQNYALYPHMTVAENIGFGLKLRHVRKAKVKERVKETAAVLGLSDLLKRKPGQLSGGQRQRVAMGRAIVRDPAAFLMDEPLSNLDAKLRVQMRAEIRRLQHELGTTTMFVTHDQTEAMTMGDRVAVMRDGRLIQLDTPTALYERPTDLFVAGFIGSPAMNFLLARLHASNGRVVAEIGATSLELPARALPASVAGRVGSDVIIGLRPEDFEDADTARTNGRPVLRAPVTLAEPVGSEVIVHLELDAPPIGSRERAGLVADDAAAEQPILEDTAHTQITACLRSRTPIVRGQTLNLAVDPGLFHFFDPDTEAALN
jgi:multiple sugar transport system ATP-binding protein